jgi:hypothetical protein
MDASVLQAAQRVVNWHLQHTVLPSPPAQPSDRAGDDEDTSSATDAQSESDNGAPSTSTRA